MIGLVSLRLVAVLLAVLLLPSAYAGTLSPEEINAMTVLCQKWGNVSDLNWPSNCSGATACSWSDVYCDDAGHIEYLEPSSYDIPGTIPSEIGDLVHLIGLYLYNNNFTGPIPDSITKLTNLEDLDIENNPHLIGPLEPIFELKALTYLWLDNIGINGTLSPSITKLASLEYFYIRENANLTGTLPYEMSSLTNLSTLELDDTGLSGCLPFNFTIDSCSAPSTMCIPQNFVLECGDAVKSENCTCDPPPPSSEMIVSSIEASTEIISSIEPSPEASLPSEVASSEVASSLVPSSEVVSSEVASSEVAPSEVASSEVASSEVASSMVASDLVSSEASSQVISSVAPSPPPSVTPSSSSAGQIGMGFISLFAALAFF